jgi:hypothetical protein
MKLPPAQCPNSVPNSDLDRLDIRRWQSKPNNTTNRFCAERSAQDKSNAEQRSVLMRFSPCVGHRGCQPNARRASILLTLANAIALAG